MPKITIYVPDDLKADMDTADGQETNWSAIAQEAFRLECQRLANRKKGSGKMNQVVERLRQSKARQANVDKTEGHAAGRAWAMNRAEYAQLQRLSAYEWDAMTVDNSRAWDVLCVIAGSQDDARGLYRPFWEAIAGAESEEPSDDFVEGFVDGALEVLEEVEDKL